jgi:tetratricopeptide (TPR) repeat protein
MSAPAALNLDDQRTRIDRVFAIARSLQQAGKWRQAEQLYLRIVTIEPRHFAALFGLGALRAQHGDSNAAARVFAAAARTAPLSAGAQASVGVALMRLNRPAEAIAYYQAALGLDPRQPDAHLNVGAALESLGRLGEAISHYEKALALRPGYAEAHNHLGRALHLIGQPEQALAHYHNALALKPDYAEAYNNLGNALYSLERCDEALSQFEQAVAINPALVSALHNLGILLASRKRPQDAMARFTQALALKPDSAEGHRNLADLLLSLNRHDEAIAHYRKTLRIRPDDAEVCNKLAFVLNKLGRSHEAIAFAKRGLSLSPHHAKAHSNLGDALMALNRDAEAIAQYEKVLRIEPSNAEAQNNIGVALQALGHLERAARAYEQAVALAPRKPSIYLNLVHAKPLTTADPRLAALEAFAQEVDTFSEEEQIALHFALGKALGDLKQSERAFHHLLMGNKLKRRQVDYNETKTLNLFARIQATFSAALLRDKVGGGDPSSLPVFIVGMPRSGTTLIEQILASHSKVFGAGESQEFGHAVVALSKPGPAFPELAFNLTADALRSLGLGYVTALTAAGSGAERIVDKMPSNFLYAGLIHLALPNARIIHARRDPIDTCWSCFSLLFAGNQPYAYDLGELGRYYRAYDRLMTHWRTVLPEGVMIEVNYEDLVDDLETHARRIIAHCGLDWEEACLSFYKTQRPVRTASSAQVRRPIYRSSIGRWRPYREQLLPLRAALESDAPGNAAASEA